MRPRDGLLFEANLVRPPVAANPIVDSELCRSEAVGRLNLARLVLTHPHRPVREQSFLVHQHRDQCWKAQGLWGPSARRTLGLQSILARQLQEVAGSLPV